MNKKNKKQNTNNNKKKNLQRTQRCLEISCYKSLEECNEHELFGGKTSWPNIETRKVQKKFSLKKLPIYFIFSKMKIWTKNLKKEKEKEKKNCSIWKSKRLTASWHFWSSSTKTQKPSNND